MSTPKPNVFLLNEHYRIVGTDGRISGSWHVLLDEREQRPRQAWVTPQDVTIYDEPRRSGVVLYSNVFTARVREGVADIGRPVRWEADIAEVRTELDALLVRVAEAAWADYDKESK